MRAVCGISRRLFPLSTVAAAAALLVFSSHAIAAPAFLEGTSELDPKTSSAWNVVDGKDTTAWCTTRGARGKQAISFTFEEPVLVTHLAIVVGKKKGEELDKTTARAQVLHVADVEHRVEAIFKDTPELQALELTPPAKGRRIVVEFDSAFAGAAADAPLCVAELVLRHKAKDLTGPAMTSKFQALGQHGRKLLKEWHDDLSAPSRTLTFNVDGTFTYTYVPLIDKDKPARVRGKWTAGATSIGLEVGGKTHWMKSRITRVDDGDEPTIELNLAGEAPHQSMVGTYRPAPLLLP